MPANPNPPGGYPPQRRWLLAAAIVATAITFVGRPGRDLTTNFVPPMAQFGSQALTAPGSPPVPAVPGGTVTFDRLDVSNLSFIDSSVASAADQPRARVTSASYAPPVRSNVVWSNKSGSISNAGLVAQHCCAGAFSVVVASKAVKFGRHYWEVTLSAAPGERHPDTYTTAGVAVATGSSTSYGYFQTRRGAAGRNDPNLLWAIGSGQSRQFQTGDVFMFALDAGKRNVFLGVNGIWINGTPGVAGGETLGFPGDELVPAVRVSASSSKPVGDSWVANFGGSNFRYPIPNGYGAYGTNVQARVGRNTSKGASANGSSSSQPPAEVDSYATAEVLVGGRKVPLPEGRWLQLAEFESHDSSIEDGALTLAKVDGKTVTSLIAIRAGNWAANTNPRYSKFDSCERQDVLYSDKDRNEANGRQQCWWVNHTGEGWQDQAAIAASLDAATRRGLSIPDAMLSLGMRSADSAGHSVILHFADPSVEGISTVAGNWHDSPWHRQNVAKDPQRRDYVDLLVDWGKNWAPLVFAYR